jgi:hypothetical protein
MWDDPALPLVNKSKPPEERVLVVVIPRLRDWEIVLNEHWYRIPVEHAPNRLSANYLAFYHTRSSGEPWTIRQYAAVTGYHLLKRRELLPGEANHPRAEHLYFKIELGPLQSLSKSIPSHKLRRITFIPTTLDRLLQAEEISDLWERDSHYDRLQRVLSLREWLMFRNY